MNRMPPKLFVSTYDATDNFRSIKKHVALCFEDGSLVGVIGSVGDRHSEAMAESIAHAVNAHETLSKAVLVAADFINDITNLDEDDDETAAIKNTLNKAIAMIVFKGTQP